MSMEREPGFMTIPLGAEGSSESESTESQMLQAIKDMKPEVAALADKLSALDQEQLSTIYDALNSEGHDPRALAWIETPEQAHEAGQLIDNVLSATDAAAKKIAKQDLYKYLRDI